jgi:uncharacterized OB-fold protein
MPAELSVQPFPGSGPAAALQPPRAGDTAGYYEGLERNVFCLQLCRSCARVRYPLAPACPYCACPEHSWAELDGRGTVHSWVRYHRAFAPAFEALVPYVVLSVQLDAGPRMFGRLASGGEAPTGTPVEMILERWEDGGRVPAFVVSRSAGTEPRPRHSESAVARR